MTPSGITWVWYYLGLDEAMLGNVDAAVSSLRKAVELDPHNYWYKRRLADLYHAAGEDDMVIQMDESILKEFPDKTDVLYDLLSLYLKQDKYEKALESLDDIEKVVGPSEQAARTRYDILRQMGKNDEAIAVLEDFNDQFTSPSVLSMMGDYYLGEYKDSLALAAYDEALRTQSDYVPAILGRAEVFRTTRRYPEYFAAMDTFITDESVPVEAKGMYVGNIIRSLDRTWATSSAALIRRSSPCTGTDSTEWWNGSGRRIPTTAPPSPLPAAITTRPAAWTRASSASRNPPTSIPRAWARPSPASRFS